MFIYLSLLISLIGLIMYLMFSGKPSGAEAGVIGLYCFWVGLLAFLITYPSHAVTLIR